MKSPNSIIIRYGELHLKGKNRSYFENKFISNIKQALSKFEFKLIAARGKYQLTEYKAIHEQAIQDTLARVFGVYSYSVCTACNADIDSIVKASLKLIKGKTFKVEVNRADKTYPLTSYQVCSSVGASILQARPELLVDVHKPDCVVSVDIRTNTKAFVYTDSIRGCGGMPYATAGKGVLMLSGGIDSPVAGYMIAKRGMQVCAVHFWSYPYTSQATKQKVISLVSQMSRYMPNLKLLVVNFTKIQEAIRDNCENSYLITITRHCMMTIAQMLAQRLNAQCIITGESLGQVASQTIESITVTNSAVNCMPVLRPLIGMDKIEIIDIAKKIDTYDISILPFEDCCNIFSPKSPVTKPTLQRAIANLCKIANLQQLIEQAVNEIDI